MRNRVLSVVVVSAFIVGSCGGGEVAGTTQADPPASETSTTAIKTSTMVAVTSTSVKAAGGGCEKPPAQPGEHEGLAMFGELEQPYWAVVPDSYADMGPVPLYLHLASGSGDHDGYLAAWLPYLDDLDGVMVLVNTTIRPRGEPTALLHLIDQLSSDYCIDPQRIHVMGTSWSSGMAELLACEASDRIASFVSSIGDLVPVSSCNPERQIPLLTFTGDTDRFHITRLVERWVEINGCDSKALIEDLGSGVLRKTYENCDSDVLFYDIEGMDHAWPLHEAKGPGAALVAEYSEVDYLDEAIRFFAEHPLP